MAALDLILLLIFGGLNGIIVWFLKNNNCHQRLFQPGTLFGAAIINR